MLNIKFALGALAAEIASWSSLWLLRSQSDAALLGYLVAHGLASALLALCLAPFLATSARSMRQRLALVALMGLFAYAVPVAGIVGAVIATIALHAQRGPRGDPRFPAMPLPDFDPHQQAGTGRRQAGLQSFLANPNVPVASRMRAMVALGSVPGRIASPMLRTALGDSSEDLRLLAYSMLDAKEREISKTIHLELHSFEQARQAQGDGALDARGLQAARALSDLYAELVYQGVAQGDVRDHAIGRSLHYCDLVLAQRPDNAQLMLRRGRLMHLLAREGEALACYERSLALGMEPARVIPYQAELLFERREFARVQALMRSLDVQHALPRLRPCISYWSVP
ncbi:Uncharacterised protein [Delftia tsuruhatensis]|uniref:hypothetical protein n=1 Tax=Delftia tsuruhatensis TaxID=180282 RepID=UPI001E6EB6FC|nr:hypothetical protein [Delftia tsuruhatensis]CAB5665640.1 Uncharacterised protein [Delftia tsuruhatensis]CAC9677603.1 Uncharacterised protein [Delftia tsuruhatensis]